jgi:predicted metal-dependent hydrolase
VVLPGKRGGAERVDGRIRIVVSDPDPDRIRNRLLGWYRQQAQHLFGERLAVISQETPWTGGEPPPMRLRKMKRTWGSCSAKGVITLNPQLVKAPPECIDYVIAHEICHLREHNHSKAFYALQDQLNPSWRKTRDQLREKEHLFLHT